MTTIASAKEIIACLLTLVHEEGKRLRTITCLSKNPAVVIAKVPAHLNPATTGHPMLEAAVAKTSGRDRVAVPQTVLLEAIRIHGSVLDAANVYVHDAPTYLYIGLQPPRDKREADRTPHDHWLIVKVAEFVLSHMEKKNGPAGLVIPCNPRASSIFVPDGATFAKDLAAFIGITSVVVTDKIVRDALTTPLVPGDLGTALCRRFNYECHATGQAPAYHYLGTRTHTVWLRHQICDYILSRLNNEAERKRLRGDPIDVVACVIISRGTPPYTDSFLSYWVARHVGLVDMQFRHEDVVEAIRMPLTPEGDTLATAFHYDDAPRGAGMPYIYLGTHQHAAYLAAEKALMAQPLPAWITSDPLADTIFTVPHLSEFAFDAQLSCLWNTPAQAAALLASVTNTR